MAKITQRGPGTIALLAWMAGCDRLVAAPIVGPPPPPRSVTKAPETAVSAPVVDEPAPALPWQAPPPVPALAAAGPRAYVADATGLVEVAAPGGSQILVPGKITWCNADARGQVVWYLQEGTLFTFDLVDRSAHQVLVGPRTLGVTGPALPIITWGNEQLGGESKVDYAIGLQLTMTGTPKVSASLGCDGDLIHYCYADAEDRNRGLLLESIVAQQEEIKGTSILIPDYLARVAARGAKGSLWSPRPALPRPPKNRPKVDKEACDADETRCGKLEAIPGSTLWKVIVGNSRGDFYHQSEALWDPLTGEFLMVSEGKLKRSKDPEPCEDLGGLRASTGGVLSLNGVVFDAKALYHAPRGDGAITCGWSDGGFRLRGPHGG